jgi:hypothetical protein
MSYHRRVGRDRNLMAELEPAPGLMRLTVILLVRYEFVIHEKNDPDWTDTEKEAWKQDFKQAAERTWSRKWYIEGTPVTGKGAGDLVEVVLSIREIPEAELQTQQQRNAWRDFLHTFRVFHACEHNVKIKSTTIGYKLVQVRQDRVEVHATKGGGSQRQTDHEVGHLLGLKHPICEGDEQWCYGEAGTPEGESVMGLGMTVSPRDYEVFADVMRQIKTDRYWSVFVTPKLVPPKPLLIRIPLVGGGHRWMGSGWDSAVKRRKP